MRLVVTIHGLLLVSIFGWHNRSSTNVVYLFSYRAGSKRIEDTVWMGAKGDVTLQVAAPVCERGTIRDLGLS
jgi:hypothetical protein